jgi:hypothetical protein
VESELRQVKQMRTVEELEAEVRELVEIIQDMRGAISRADEYVQGQIKRYIRYGFSFDCEGLQQDYAHVEKAKKAQNRFGGMEPKFWGRWP